MARKVTDPHQRFWAKVDKTDGCWLWTATKIKGYGSFQLSTTPRRQHAYAHRLAYEWLVGPIPQGMVIDHICHNPACVNPDHLRATTHKQNIENREGAQRNNRSGGIRGVTWLKDKQKWRVQAQHNGVHHIGGYFTDIQEAEAAAIALRNRLFTHNEKDRND